MKRISFIYLLFLILVAKPVLSQSNMNWEWVRTAGGYQTQKATAIAVDNNNDVIIAGTYTSNYIMLGTNNVFLANSDSTSFSSNYFIAKYNQSGQVIWAEKAQCNAGTSSGKIITDNNGNIYASGFISNTNSVFNAISFDGNSTYTHNNGGKSFLVKYSSQGIAQWVMFINNKYWGYDTISALKWDEKSNSVIIGGYCLGDSVTIGGYNISNSGNNMQFSFIAKVNIQQGNVVWLKSSKGNAFASKINDIAIDTSGAIYTASSFTGSSLILSSNDTLVNSTSASGAIFTDGYIAKYDNNGQLIWFKKGNCNSNDEATTIGYRNNNRLIIGGYNNSLLTINSASLNQGNHILEFDLQGNFLNAQNFPATIKTINSYKTGSGYFICGNFTQDTLKLGSVILHKFSNPTNLNTNIYIARCDSFGIYNVAISAGGYSSSQINASYVADSNKIYSCGSYNQASIKFGNTVYNSTGLTDIFLAKLNTGFSIPVPYKYNLGGTVFAGLLPVDFAMVYLYDTNQNIVDTRFIDSSSMGFYQFYQKTAGNYKVSAELVSNSVYFMQNYISTFYPNKTNFEDAAIILLNTNKWGKDIQLQKTSSLTDNKAEDYEINLFPNPAKNELSIRGNKFKSGVSRIEIFDIKGYKVQSYNNLMNEKNEIINLNIASLIPGIYYILIADNKGNTVRLKFIKLD